MQFYATIYFHNDDARTLSWMSGTRDFSAPFAKFVDVLPAYQFYTEPHPDFHCIF